MKRLLAVFLCLTMLLCGAAQAEAADQTYTYEFDGMMGKETMQIVLGGDGVATLSLPGNTMITDVYAGSWESESDGTVAISGLKNVDAASPYAVPGLWDWIDKTTGDCRITLDEGVGTFAPAQSAAENASGEPSAEDASLSDIAYASNSDAQKLDLILPEGDGPFPLLILVHGGGFAMGDKQMPIVQKMSAFTDAGYALASVNYRLSGEAVYPAAIADVKAAVRFLRKHAEEYGLDADRFAIWGESAGAYLAVMTAVTGDDVLLGDVADNADVSSGVKAVVDFYGPMTFFQMDEDFAALGLTGSTNTDDSFESKFMGCNIGALTDETKAEMSPMTYLHEGMTLCAWIQAGTGDTNVPYLQSKRLAEAMTAALGQAHVTYGTIEGAVHMDDAFYTEENLNAVLDFLNTALQ